MGTADLTAESASGASAQVCERMDFHEQYGARKGCTGQLEEFSCLFSFYVYVYIHIYIYICGQLNLCTHVCVIGQFRAFSFPLVLFQERQRFLRRPEVVWKLNGH